MNGHWHFECINRNRRVLTSTSISTLDHVNSYEYLVSIVAQALNSEYRCEGAQNCHSLLATTSTSIDRRAAIAVPNLEIYFLTWRDISALQV